LQEKDWSADGFLDAIAQTDSRRLISCSMCSRKLPSPSAWRFHMLNHRGSKLMCRRCCRCFCRRYTFNAHDNERCPAAKFSCLLCPFEAVGAESLPLFFDHVADHEPFEKMGDGNNKGENDREGCDGESTSIF
jgi:hypothetical protein